MVVRLSSAWLFLPLGLVLGCTSPEPPPQQNTSPALARVDPQLAALLDRRFRDRLLLLYLYPVSLSFRYRAIVMPFATKRVLEHHSPDELAATDHNAVFLYPGRGALGPRPASFTQQLHAFDHRLDQEEGERPVSPRETLHLRREGTRWVVDSLAHALMPLVELAPPPPAPRLLPAPQRRP